MKRSGRPGRRISRGQAICSRCRSIEFAQPVVRSGSRSASWRGRSSLDAAAQGSGCRLTMAARSNRPARQRRTSVASVLHGSHIEGLRRQPCAMDLDRTASQPHLPAAAAGSPEARPTGRCYDPGSPPRQGVHTSRHRGGVSQSDVSARAAALASRGCRRSDSDGLRPGQHDDGGMFVTSHAVPSVDGSEVAMSALGSVILT